MDLDDRNVHRVQKDRGHVKNVQRNYAPVQIPITQMIHVS